MNTQWLALRMATPLVHGLLLFLMNAMAHQVGQAVVPALPCRVVVLSLSKPLHHVAQTSTMLWEDISCAVMEPSQLQALGRWLSSRRQQLGSLELVALQTSPRLMQELMLLLGKLAGSSLHSLVLLLSSPFVIGSWVAGLPHLQHLEVYGPHSQVEAGLAEAAVLTSMYLRSSHGPISLPPGLLPPNLRSLHLYGLSTNPFLSPNLPPLVCLSISFNAADDAEDVREGVLEQLSRLVSVTRLALSITSASIPRHLTALTALANLRLTGSSLDGSVLNAADDATWAPLLACTRLTFLDFSNCGLETLPASVLSLPRLEVGAFCALPNLVILQPCLCTLLSLGSTLHCPPAAPVCHVKSLRFTYSAMRAALGSGPQHHVQLLY